MGSVIGDIRDFGGLWGAFRAADPEYVIHLAAQPLVGEGYRDPRGTFSVNVMGTANILECLRLWPSARSFLNVTTDKVYRNREWAWGYREEDALGGLDPYSASKSCSELVTRAYAWSFPGGRAIPASTARAGNVIGGGDFARDRLVPDLVRAALSGEPAILRNPGSLRPYQHVLDALSAYMAILKGQEDDPSLAGAYNAGPLGCLSSEGVARLFKGHWGEGFSYRPGEGGPIGKEAGALTLDSSLIGRAFGWKGVWDIGKAVAMTVGWERARSLGGDLVGECDRQIGEYSDDWRAMRKEGEGF
jgi:CDP-glucose 4,6-dehydratase